MVKVAIITGSTRGIGRHIALELARHGYHITVTGKSLKGTKRLPGDIYSVAEEIRKLGQEALPCHLDLRDEKTIENCVKQTIKKWNRVDVLINNASALWWTSVLDTPKSRYDLINNINSRGSFLMSRQVIPHMMKSGKGFIINLSPPITLDNTNTMAFSLKDLKNKTAYMISKLGMTLSALGIAEEFKGKNISSNTLWPLRPIESYALINHKLGNKKLWRKPQIISDCILHILKEDPIHFTGRQLIDEYYLQTKGVQRFEKYNCEKGSMPPLLNSLQSSWKVGKSKSKL